MGYTIYICMKSQHSGRIHSEYRVKGKTVNAVQRSFIKLFSKRRQFKKLVTCRCATISTDRQAVTPDDIHIGSITFYKNCKRQGLTKTETEIMFRQRQGGYHKEVFNDLHICDGTGKSHLHRIFKKLNVHTVEDALKKLDPAMVCMLSYVLSEAC